MTDDEAAAAIELIVFVLIGLIVIGFGVYMIYGLVHPSEVSIYLPNHIQLFKNKEEHEEKLGTTKTEEEEENETFAASRETKTEKGKEVQNELSRLPPMLLPFGYRSKNLSEAVFNGTDKSNSEVSPVNEDLVKPSDDEYADIIGVNTELNDKAKEKFEEENKEAKIKAAEKEKENELEKENKKNEFKKLAETKEEPEEAPPTKGLLGNTGSTPSFFNKNK